MEFWWTRQPEISIRELSPKKRSRKKREAKNTKKKNFFFSKKQTNRTHEDFFLGFVVLGAVYLSRMQICPGIVFLSRLSVWSPFVFIWSRMSVFLVPFAFFLSRHPLFMRTDLRFVGLFIGVQFSFFLRAKHLGSSQCSVPRAVDRRFNLSRSVSPPRFFLFRCVVRSFFSAGVCTISFVRFLLGCVWDGGSGSEVKNQPLRPFCG